MEIILYGIIGWFGGVLVNYFSDVLPVKRRFTRPLCTACFEPQPIMQYLVWPRCCAECLSRRPFRVWIVELGFIWLSIWLWKAPPDPLAYLPALALFIYFGVVVVIDMEHRLILHPVSYVGAALCLGMGWWLHGLPATLIGGAVGFVIMWVFHVFGEYFSRWIARRRGEVLTEVALGFGDVNLSGILGLLLGWPGIMAGLLLAVLLGGVISAIYIIVMLLRGRYKAFTPIPYGPFLIVAAVILMFFSDQFITLLP